MVGVPKGRNAPPPLGIITCLTPAGLYVLFLSLSTANVSPHSLALPATPLFRCQNGAPFRWADGKPAITRSLTDKRPSKLIENAAVVSETVKQRAGED
jgi:hypothetical protein